jgi:hypothetical protein
MAVLMQRGGCEFGVKALNAAGSNARAVVVIDTQSSSGDGLITMKTAKEAARTLDILAVSIPKSDGRILLDLIKSNAKIRLYLMSAQVGL